MAGEHDGCGMGNDGRPRGRGGTERRDDRAWSRERTQDGRGRNPPPAAWRRTGRNGRALPTLPHETPVPRPMLSAAVTLRTYAGAIRVAGNEGAVSQSGTLQLT